MSQTKSVLKFLSHRIVESKFQSSWEESSESHPKLHLSHEIETAWDSGTKQEEDEIWFKSSLIVTVSDKEDLFFKVKIEGLFSIAKSANEQVRKNISQKNAPAILYPFLRAYMASLTSLAGINPVVLPIINFSRKVTTTP